MGYWRRTSNYLERISLFDLTHMMSMVDPMAMGVETPKIDSGRSLENEFTKLICMNPSMILCQNINKVHLFHNYYVIL